MRRLAGWSLLLLLGLPAQGDPGVLRIVTYNIHHAEGVDGKLDVDRIVGILRALNPDVVCLQEVDRNLPRTQHMDMPALFAEKLGMPVVFEPNYRFEGGEYGNAILSKWPIVSHKNHALPNPENVEPRGCLQVELLAGQTPVQVFCTHLGLRAPERAAQAEAIVALLPAKGPVVLCGDMNENEQGAGMKAFLARLQDTLLPEPAPSWSFPAPKPARRIDYILASEAWTAKEGSIVRTPETAVASDHLPLVAVLELK